jgi:hypothetical protein
MVSRGSFARIRAGAQRRRARPASGHPKTVRVTSPQRRPSLLGARNAGASWRRAAVRPVRGCAGPDRGRRSADHRRRPSARIARHHAVARSGRASCADSRHPSAACPRRARSSAIDAGRLSEHHKAALWLLAWSLRDPALQRRYPPDGGSVRRRRVLVGPLSSAREAWSERREHSGSPLVRLLLYRLEAAVGGEVAPRRAAMPMVNHAIDTAAPTRRSASGRQGAGTAARPPANCLQGVDGSKRKSPSSLTSLLLRTMTERPPRCPVRSRNPREEQSRDASSRTIGCSSGTRTATPTDPTAAAPLPGRCTLAPVAHG